MKHDILRDINGYWKVCNILNIMDLAVIFPIIEPIMNYQLWIWHPLMVTNGYFYYFPCIIARTCNNISGQYFFMVYFLYIYCIFCEKKRYEVINSYNGYLSTSLNFIALASLLQKVNLHSSWALLPHWLGFSLTFSFPLSYCRKVNVFFILIFNVHSSGLTGRRPRMSSLNVSIYLCFTVSVYCEVFVCVGLWSLTPVSTTFQ